MPSRFNHGPAARIDEIKGKGITSMQIPERIKRSIDAYVTHRQPVGGFLQAVLSNQLFEAVGRADNESMAALREIIQYIYNEIPAKSWGSPLKYLDHLRSAD